MKIKLPLSLSRAHKEPRWVVGLTWVGLILLVVGMIDGSFWPTAVGVTLMAFVGCVYFFLAMREISRLLK